MARRGRRDSDVRRRQLVSAPTTRIALLLAATAVAMLARGAQPEDARASTLPTGFQETVAFSGLTNPTVVRFARDGRVFVAEKSGIIKVFCNLSDTTPTTFANLRHERPQLLGSRAPRHGAAPELPGRPRTSTSSTRTTTARLAEPRRLAGETPCPTPPGPTSDGCVVSARVSRLQAAGDVMTGSEQVLVEDWCQQYPSHSIGSVEFGPDGALYASAGDGASFNFVDWGQDGNPVNPCGDPPAGVGGTMTPPTAEGGALRSQDVRTTGDPASLDGSVIRVDPATGAGLPSNPFAGSADATRDASSPTASGTRSASPSARVRASSGPGTSAGEWEEINAIYNAERRDGRELRLALLRGQPAAQPAMTPRISPSARTSTPPRAPTRALLRVPPPGQGSARAKPARRDFLDLRARVQLRIHEHVPDAVRGRALLRRLLAGLHLGDEDGGGSTPSPARSRRSSRTRPTRSTSTFGPGGDLFYADFDGGTIRRIRWTAKPPPTITGRSPAVGATGVAVDANVPPPSRRR